MDNQRWAAHLVGAFAAVGVRHAVIAPGSRSTPLALALAARSDLTCWPVLDERSAGFFALGLAKGSRAPTLVLCTSGSAGAHFLPAVIEAHYGEVPLWVLTADRPWELHDFGAPQTIEQSELFKPFLRGAVQFPVPTEREELYRHVSALVARAGVDAARGPWHGNVPFDEPLAPQAPVLPLTPSMPQFAPKQLKPDLTALVAAVRAAKRGLIYVGPRPPDAQGAEALRELGRHLGFPVLAEAASNVRYGADDVVALYDALSVEEFAPDLVLHFGGTPTTKRAQSISAPRFFVVAEGHALSDPTHRATDVVFGAAQEVARELTAAVPRATEHTWRQRWLQCEARARTRLAEETGWSEMLIAREVASGLPAETNLFVASSMPIRDLDAYGPAAAAQLAVYCNRGANGIDGLTSTALGVAAATKRPTVLYIGDLAFLHDLSGWLLAKQLGLSLLVLLVNNDGGGIFHFLPRLPAQPSFERYFALPHGTSFSAVAALTDARYRKVQSVPELRAELARGGEPGLTLLELAVERSSNFDAHRILNRALHEAGRRDG